MLWLCAHYPRLPLDAIRVGVDQSAGQVVDNSPLAVTESRGGQRLLAVLNDIALQRGLTTGMGLLAALSLVPDLIASERRHDQEQALLEAEACWAYRFGNPVTISTSCLSVWVEIGRSLKLFGGWKPLAEALLADEQKTPPSMAPRRRLGVAPTQACAYLLATSALHPRKPIRLVADIPKALASLPTHLLPLSRAALEVLQGSGLNRVGEVLTIPAEALTPRIGAEGQLALDRLLGRVPEVWQSWVPLTVYRRHFDFQDPIETTEALLFPLRILLVEFVRYLKARSLAVQQFVIRLVDSRNRRLAFEIGLLAPTQDPARLLLVVREKLDKIELEDAATEVTLEATRFESLDGDQDEMFTTGQRQRLAQRLTELKERLIARLGSDAVREIRLSPDQRPECATAVVAAGSSSRDATDSASSPVHARSHPPRPIWILDHPERIEPPQLLSPVERIDLGWWQGQNSTRDYHLAQDDRKRLCWVFHTDDAPNHWYLHGLWQ